MSNDVTAYTVPNPFGLPLVVVEGDMSNEENAAAAFYMLTSDSACPHAISAELAAFKAGAEYQRAADANARPWYFSWLGRVVGPGYIITDATRATPNTAIITGHNPAAALPWATWTVQDSQPYAEADHGHYCATDSSARACAAFRSIHQAHDHRNGYVTATTY